MKALVLTALVAFSLAAPSATLAVSDMIAKKSEPAPKDRDERKNGEERPDPREETYEGNSRGGSFDGGGYDSGSEGGMIGEVFYVKNQGKKLAPGVKLEDRGTTLVYTEISYEDMSASETCTTITRTVLDKASKKVLSQDSDTFCNNWPL